MAGAAIIIGIQDEQALAALQALLVRVTNLAPAFARIGEYGLQSSRERIESQNAGNPVGIWAPLSERYLKSPKKRAHHPGMILELYGDLVSTLAWQALGEKGVEWGSNRIYAAAQQFGRDEIVFPTRVGMNRQCLKVL